MGWYLTYRCLVGIYRIVLALGVVYVCYDEAFGECNQIVKAHIAGNFFPQKPFLNPHIRQVCCGIRKGLLLLKFHHYMHFLVMLFALQPSVLKLGRVVFSKYHSLYLRFLVTLFALQPSVLKSGRVVFSKYTLSICVFCGGGGAESSSALTVVR